MGKVNQRYGSIQRKQKGKKYQKKKKERKEKTGKERKNIHRFRTPEVIASTYYVS